MFSEEVHKRHGYLDLFTDATCQSQEKGRGVWETILGELL